MVWLVRTRFYAGIFLSRKKTEKYAKAKIRAFDDYKEAVEKLDEIIKTEKYVSQIGIFKPNRLYQVCDKRIYFVLYTKHKVGFFNDEKLNSYQERTGEDITEYKALGRFDYERAVWWVNRLGAKTGKTEVLNNANPVCGWMLSLIHI